jgi:hypothetical protein
MGPSKAFRPIAPNGNSTDGRQTFFQPSGLQTFIQCLETWPGSAMIDLPTIEGTSNRVPPLGTAAAGPVMCTSMARKAWCVHIAGKKSLVCAHRWPGRR